MSDEQKLLPCPMCGKDKACLCSRTNSMNQTEYYDEYRVECKECSLELGHWDDNYRDDGTGADTAVEEWNSLPRKPHWTTNNPTEPGWYWWRMEKGSRPYMTYVFWESSVRSVKKDRLLVVYSFNDAEFSVENRCGDWAGPIPEPCDD